MRNPTVPRQAALPLALARTTSLAAAQADRCQEILDRERERSNARLQETLERLARIDANITLITLAEGGFVRVTGFPPGEYAEVIEIHRAADSLDTELTLARLDIEGLPYTRRVSIREVQHAPVTPPSGARLATRDGYRRT